MRMKELYGQELEDNITQTLGFIMTLIFIGLCGLGVFGVWIILKALQIV